MGQRGKKLIIGFLYRGASYAISIGIAFFMMPFILHHLGDRQYGLWVLIGSFMGYMGYLDFGISAAVGRLVSRAIGQQDKDTINKIANTAFGIYVIISILTILITTALMAGAGYFVKDVHDLQIVRFLLFCVGLSLTLGFPTRAFGSVITANLKYQMSESIITIELILRNILIYNFFTWGFGIKTLGATVCATSIFSYVLWVFFAFKAEPKLCFNFKYFCYSKIREIASYSIFSFISNLATILIHRIDALVITVFLGLAHVAHFNVANVLMTYALNFLNRTTELIAPVFSQDDGRNDTDGLKYRFFMTTKITIYMSVFISLMAICYGSFFIRRWVGSEYLDAYPVLIVISLSNLVSGIIRPTQVLLFNTSHQKYLAIRSIIEGFMNLGLSIILVKMLGMIGVALGTLISIFIIRLFFQGSYVCKTLGIGHRQYFFDLLIKNVFLAFIAILPIFFILKNQIKPTYPYIFGFGLLHLAVFLPMAYFLGFKKHERNYLLGFIQKKAKSE
jgi:O-antigen/teichoic acid export membrane protein